LEEFVMAKVPTPPERPDESPRHEDLAKRPQAHLKKKAQKLGALKGITITENLPSSSFSLRFLVLC
jgi:hypothetical protein